MSTTTTSTTGVAGMAGFTCHNRGNSIDPSRSMDTSGKKPQHTNQAQTQTQTQKSGPARASQKAQSRYTELIRKEHAQQFIKHLAYKIIEGAILDFWRGLSVKGTPREKPDVMQKMKEAEDFMMNDEALGRWCQWIDVSVDYIRNNTIYDPPAHVFEQKKFKRLESIARTDFDTEHAQLNLGGTQLEEDEDLKELDKLAQSAPGADEIDTLNPPARQQFYGQEVLSFQDVLNFIRVKQKYRKDDLRKLSLPELVRAHHLPYKLKNPGRACDPGSTITIQVPFRPLKGAVVRYEPVKVQVVAIGLGICPSPVYITSEKTVKHNEEFVVIHTKSGLVVAKAPNEYDARRAAKAAARRKIWASTADMVLADFIMARLKEANGVDVSVSNIQELDAAYASRQQEQEVDFKVHPDEYFIIERFRKAQSHAELAREIQTAES